MAHLPYVMIVVAGLSVLAHAPAQAVGTEDTAVETALAPDYAAAKARIDAQDYAGALPMLDLIIVAEPANANAWNLHGFANRKLGKMKAAAKSYETALKLNPAHLGALEYQGEMFLELGQPDMAKANLTRLQDLCGNCEEAEDLAQALAAAGA